MLRVNHLVDRVLGAAGVPEAVPVEAGVALSEAELTWGLQVTKAAASRYTGRGIKVAVLDTGLDLLHPDLVGRRIESKSAPPGFVRRRFSFECVAASRLRERYDTPAFAQLSFSAIVRLKTGFSAEESAESTQK